MTKKKKTVMDTIKEAVKEVVEVTNEEVKKEEKVEEPKTDTPEVELLSIEEDCEGFEEV